MRQRDGKQRLTDWNGDNCVGDLVAEVSLGSFLHLGENHSTNFLRSLSERERGR
jgi:hypothetical protein